MEPKDFNDTFLQNLIEKLSFENKNIILMGDFNIDILKYDTNKDSEEFLDKMYTNFLWPYITSLLCVTPRSQTLIDNFFSNIIEESSNSDNLTTTISDHFVQFVLFKTKKTNINVIARIKSVLDILRTWIKKTLNLISKKRSGMKY